MGKVSRGENVSSPFARVQKTIPDEDEVTGTKVFLGGKEMLVRVRVWRFDHDLMA